MTSGARSPKVNRLTQGPPPAAPTVPQGFLHWALLSLREVVVISPTHLPSTSLANIVEPQAPADSAAWPSEPHLRSKVRSWAKALLWRRAAWFRGAGSRELTVTTFPGGVVSCSSWGPHRGCGASVRLWSLGQKRAETFGQLGIDDAFGASAGDGDTEIHLSVEGQQRVRGHMPDTHGQRPRPPEKQLLPSGSPLPSLPWWQARLYPAVTGGDTEQQATGTHLLKASSVNQKTQE